MTPIGPEPVAQDAGACALIASLTPNGRVALARAVSGAVLTPARAAERIERAFARGTGHGLL